jgi:hypothetical protein
MLFCLAGDRSKMTQPPFNYPTVSIALAGTLLDIKSELEL